MLGLEGGLLQLCLRAKLSLVGLKDKFVCFRCVCVFVCVQNSPKDGSLYNLVICSFNRALQGCVFCVNICLHLCMLVCALVIDLQQTEGHNKQGHI